MWKQNWENILMLQLIRTTTNLARNNLRGPSKSEMDEKHRNGDGPDDPSEDESKGDAMAGLGLEVGDDLWDLRNPPADEANQTEAE